MAAFLLANRDIPLHACLPMLTFLGSFINSLTLRTKYRFTKFSEFRIGLLIYLQKELILQPEFRAVESDDF